MTVEELNELQGKLYTAQSLAEKIDTAEYLENVLLTRSANPNIESKVLQKAIQAMATSSQKEKVVKLLSDIGIATVEKETFEKIIQLISERKATLQAELANYQIQG